jgi:hypothetical protein
MTDNDIKKALECCIDCKCKECPCYKNIEGEMRCTEIDEEEILDLINRQQAEIEELKTLCDMQDKIMLEQKVILEAINDEFNPLPFETDFYKAIKTAKTEAIKEFAERLNKHSVYADDYDCFMVSTESIDNLVKEMTEVSE